MNIKHLGELIGQRIVVTADGGTLGYMIAERHLNARRLAATGIVQGWVPGHGGDVVYVEQEDTQPGAEPIGVYCHLTELEFYSSAALAFAKEKAEQVQILDRQLTELRRKPFPNRARQISPPTNSDSISPGPSPEPS